MPTGVLFGQILVVLTTAVTGVWAATQWTAAALGYQAQLGPPWFRVSGVPIYGPWKLFEWWNFFDAYAPAVFLRGGIIAASSGMLAATAAVGAAVWRSRAGKRVTTYGSACWAEHDEVCAADLTESAGVFLGRLPADGDYLRHEGPEHVMAFAPTRSGKGVGLVVPTLLTWTGSAVVHDINGENWQLTAGWRSRFSHCLQFNPTNVRSAAYNPLLEVRRGEHEVRDVQNIADILVDPEGALERRNHWEKTSHALLVGAILHMLYAGEDKTFGLQLQLHQQMGWAAGALPAQFEDFGPVLVAQREVGLSHGSLVQRSLRRSPWPSRREGRRGLPSAPAIPWMAVFAARRPAIRAHASAPSRPALERQHRPGRRPAPASSEGRA